LYELPELLLDGLYELTELLLGESCFESGLFELLELLLEGSFFLRPFGDVSMGGMTGLGGDGYLFSLSELAYSEDFLESYAFSNGFLLSVSNGFTGLSKS